MKTEGVEFISSGDLTSITVAPSGAVMPDFTCLIRLFSTRTSAYITFSPVPSQTLTFVNNTLVGSSISWEKENCAATNTEIAATIKESFLLNIVGLPTRYC